MAIAGKRMIPISPPALFGKFSRRADGSVRRVAAIAWEFVDDIAEPRGAVLPYGPIHWTGRSTGRLGDCSGRPQVRDRIGAE